jgi:fatty acid desaturase
VSAQTLAAEQRMTHWAAVHPPLTRTQRRQRLVLRGVGLALACVLLAAAWLTAGSFLLLWWLVKYTAIFLLLGCLAIIALPVVVVRWL